MTNRVHDTQYFRTPYLTGSPQELDGGAVVLLIDDKPNSQRPEVIDSRSHVLKVTRPASLCPSARAGHCSLHHVCAFHALGHRSEQGLKHVEIKNALVEALKPVSLQCYYCFFIVNGYLSTMVNVTPC